MRSFFFQITMDGDTKKPLKIVISDFYKLHMNKGKEYTFKKFKKFGIHKATICLIRSYSSLLLMCRGNIR